ETSCFLTMWARISTCFAPAAGAPAAAGAPVAAGALVAAGAAPAAAAGLVGSAAAGLGAWVGWAGAWVGAGAEHAASATAARLRPSRRRRLNVRLIIPFTPSLRNASYFLTHLSTSACTTFAASSSACLGDFRL